MSEGTLSRVIGLLENHSWARWLLAVIILSSPADTLGGVWAYFSGGAERDTIQVLLANERTYLRGEIREMKVDTSYLECMLEPTNGDSIIVVNNQRRRFCERVQERVRELLVAQLSQRSKQ